MDEGFELLSAIENDVVIFYCPDIVLNAREKTIVCICLYFLKGAMSRSVDLYKIHN